MILFFTDPSPDYGADYLYDGFCDLLGIENVLDWPCKPSLHGMRHGFDCDLVWPRLADFDYFDDVGIANMLATRGVDLIVIPTLRGEVPIVISRLAGYLERNRDRVVLYHAEDQAQDVLPTFVELAGFEPALYYRREMPIGASPGRPLPFGYPRTRVTALGAEPRPPALIYAAHVWPWAIGKLRDQLFDALRELGNATTASMRLQRSTDAFPSRPCVEEYHILNRMASVAVSPAGAGYGTNRHLEIIADGCCPLLERPTVEWPNAPLGGQECVYFSDAQECVEAAGLLLSFPQVAHLIARNAQAWLLRHHTTKCRAETILSDLSRLSKVI